MASKDFRFAIDGLDEIKENLKRLDSAMVKNINRAAARAGAVVIKKAADSKLPVGQRNRKKIDISANRRVNRNRFSYKIGPRVPHYGLRFLEYGAAPHDIGPETAKALAIYEESSTTTNIRDIGVYQGFVVKKVKHPGIKPTRFLSRALSENVQKVFKAIGDKYWQRIRKEIK